MELHEMNLDQFIARMCWDDADAIFRGTPTEDRVGGIVRLALKWDMERNAELIRERFAGEMHPDSGTQNVASDPGALRPHEETLAAREVWRAANPAMMAAHEAAQPPPADVAAPWDGYPLTGANQWSSHMLQSTNSAHRFTGMWHPESESWAVNGMVYGTKHGARWWTYAGPVSDPNEAAAVALSPEAGRHVTLSTEHYFDGQRFDAGRYRLVRIDGDGGDAKF